jgi:hypothetical protein
MHVHVRFLVLVHRLIPLSARARAEVERHEAVSGFSSRIQDFEVSVSDPSGQHSLSYLLALRSVLPLPHVGRSQGLFLSASSAEVVADCDSSTKSSLLYSFTRNMLNDPVAPSSGYRASFSSELAGLGGDVSFVKSTLQHSAAASFMRFAPDTGFALPLSRSAFLAASPYDFGEGRSGADALTGGGELRPHPGPAAYSAPWTWSWPWGAAVKSEAVAKPVALVDELRPVLAARDFLKGKLPMQRTLDADAAFETTLAPLGGPRSWSTGRQIAGWLAPGVTLRVDSMLGVVFPFSDDSLRPTGTRILDRFFLFGSSARGFESIGPKAAPVPGGTRNGDVLGGNAIASFSARLLFPPPLPSITLANAGLRTQVFATAGALLPRADATSLSPLNRWKSVAASAGVGLVSP